MSEELKKETAAAAATKSHHNHHVSSNSRGVVSRFVRRVGGTLKTGLAVVGVATLAGAYMEYKRINPEASADKTKDEKEKKKVLVIPFHRLQLLERKDTSLRSQLSQLEESSSDDGDSTLKLEVRELVELLHHAASDPDIVGLYGIFGHGGTGLASAGWADLEEIRNALRVFRESHRRHSEPNIQYQMQVIPRVQNKPMYAYADTFASLMDPANKDYYLASIFTHVHMQQQGELNLFGMLSQQFFLRDFMEKYGIQLHVFKQGIYKNAPNMFTHTKFNNAHRENVSNILENINKDVCQDITKARSTALLTAWLSQKNEKHDQGEIWKKIHESGTFPAVTAWKAGLVDYLPHRDPLPDLVESRKNGEGKENEGKEGDTSKGDPEKLNRSKTSVNLWKLQETDFGKFNGDDALGLKDYMKQISKKKSAEKRKEFWSKHAEEHPSIKPLLKTAGFISDEESPIDKKKEKIALVQVTGTIGDSAARKLVNTLRKIRKEDNIKCIVLRVSSPGGSIFACETISQELKALELPVVVSFGNVAASGGYYISSAADRIFSSSKTITGSIGVFGIRMDLTGLAKQYGINVQHVAAGDLAGTYSPFHPMTRKMKNMMSDSIDRYYEQFKGVVSEGRILPTEYVEELAKGRVWTGDQGKTNGLVDELGGLHRAIAYAQRNHTETGEAEVDVWPKKRTFIEKLKEAREQGDATMLWNLGYEWATECLSESRDSSDDNTDVTTDSLSGGLVEWIMRSPTGVPSSLSGVMLAADENTAIRCILENAKQSQSKPHIMPSYFWE